MTKITKKYYKLKKYKKCAHWNLKLKKYDLTIDLADIKHISRKMYETGKISRKVLKKWRKRDYTRAKNSWCGKKGGSRKKCLWLPASVFRKYHTKHFIKFTWHCLYCRSETEKVYDDEVSESLANAYPEHLVDYKFY